MDPRTRNTFVLAIGVILAAGAMVFLIDRTGPSDSSNAPSVVGVVVRIDSLGLDQVRGFDVRTSDGTTVTFVMGPLENGASFPPGHLGEHQATAEPVRVFYRDEGATKVAIRIDDAA